MRHLRWWWLPGFLMLILMAEAAQGADPIVIKADLVKRAKNTREAGGYLLTLSGNVQIRHGKTEITCTEAVYDDKTGTLTAVGGVSLTNEGITVKAKSLNYVRDTEECVFKGKVTLARDEEKDSEGKVTKDPFSLSCEELSISAATKSFSALGQVELAYKDTKATAGKMIYGDAKQQMQLLEQPILIHEDEKVVAEEILLDIAADTSTITKAEITFNVDDEQSSGEQAP